jgi:hypothetical protein
MVQRYSHLSVDHVAGSVNVLDGILQGSNGVAVQISYHAVK